MSEHRYAKTVEQQKDIIIAHLGFIDIERSQRSSGPFHLIHDGNDHQFAFQDYYYRVREEAPVKSPEDLVNQCGLFY